MKALEAELRERLRRPLPGAEVQYRFAPRPLLPQWHPSDRPAGARDAAALMLIYPGPEGPTIALTERHAGLPHHAGQISLPGGGLRAGETPAEAALRELEEEVGVPADQVRLIGPLSPLWVLVSRFVVHPWIGVADTRPAFALAPGEVASLVEAPVALVRHPAHLRWGQQPRDGQPMMFPYFDVAGQQVWGATAMILGEFGALFDPAFGPGPPDRWARPLRYTG